MAFQKSKILRILLFLFFIAISARHNALAGVRQRSVVDDMPAQEENLSVTLARQIIEAKTKDGAYLLLEESRDIYFANNQYNEFVALLDSLRPKRKDLHPAIDYYTGLARLRQLKYLEEAQEWNEYFNQGDFYRGQLAGSLQKAIEGTSYLNEVNLYSRLALWQYYNGNDDPSSAAVLTGLCDSVRQYCQIKQEIEPVRKIADALKSAGEKVKAKELYALYIKKVTEADIKDSRLKEIASIFYTAGNLELSEGLYDVYIERALPGNKQKLAAALKEIAGQFAYQDGGRCDPFYAEKIFTKIDEFAAKPVLEEELIYLRAFNLEKMKDFSGAKDKYAALVEHYPASSRFDEAAFKSGLICAYILQDRILAKGFFEKLIQRKKVLSPHVVSAYYQLGLLAQWEGDSEKAKSYYLKLSEEAAEDFSDTFELAQARLKEIEEKRPLEYNLRIFLEASLKNNSVTQRIRNADLSCSPYRARPGEEVSAEARLQPVQSGCIPVKLNYLWSGHIGEKAVPAGERSLKLSYNSAGTKEINLIVVSPPGVIGYAVDLVDVEQPQ